MKLIRSYYELVKWIRENTDQRDPEGSAIWFVSYTEAKTIFDDMTVKELAGTIHRGIGPVNSAYVNNWIRTLYDDLIYVAELDDTLQLAVEIDAAVAEEYCVYDVVAELESFFNVG